MRLKYLAKHVDERLVTPEMELMSVSKTKGVIPRSEISDADGRAEDISHYKTCQPGDLVINRMSAYQGALGIAKQVGAVSPDYMVLRFGPKIAPEFGGYFFKSHQTISLMSSLVKGIGSVDSGSVRTPRLSWTDLGNSPVSIPTLEEQVGIAEFLDRETTQIDELIRKQQQLIETLEERRKAVITIAITRGLDSTVPLVDSGSERLGKIPKHWIPQTFRRIGQLESGTDYKQFEVEEGGYPVIGSGGEFRRVSKFMFEGESVLFGRKGTIDKPLYVNCAFWTVDTMYWTRLNSNVVAKFIYYWATTLPFMLFTTNTALPSMTSSDIKNFEIALPPMDEQAQISNYLDETTGSIDALSSKAQEMIEVLKERRQGLISAAVTGKIDVRGK